MKASDFIAKYLEQRGVTHVFELIGGMITFLVDSIHQVSTIKIISMHHEQGAAFAAEGFARASGIPGVALATSGPGATNLLTAIGSCYFDSIPAVFITGQVNRHEQKGARPIRQLGFQETDIVSMARPITKAAWLVNDPQMLPQVLDDAFSLALSGRKGPILIDIPMDVQRADILDVSAADMKDAVNDADEEIEIFISRLQDALNTSKRPLILAGGGIVSARCVSAFRELVGTLGIPVVNTLMAVDVLPSTSKLRIGLIGSYGNRWSNIALCESDFLLVLGSRLDVRQTGSNPSEISEGRPVFHVDCESGEINNRVKGCEPLVSQVDVFIDSFLSRLSGVGGAYPDWCRHIDEIKSKWPDTMELADIDGINPNIFMHRLSHYSELAAAYVVDVGQHQMWAAQSLELTAEQRFLTSGGMGAMGFALPAAIGACLAAGKPIVVVAGDGGMQLNIQELQTIIRNDLPIKIVVLNNQSHGMVRQFQESYFKGRLQSSSWGYSAPSFVAVAAAYGIKSMSVNTQNDVDAALMALWKDPKSPFLLEVLISPSANVYPKLAFGKSLSDMEPFVKPEEMEGT